MKQNLMKIEQKPTCTILVTSSCIHTYRCALVQCWERYADEKSNVSGGSGLLYEMKVFQQVWPRLQIHNWALSLWSPSHPHPILILLLLLLLLIVTGHRHWPSSQAIVTCHRHMPLSQAIVTSHCHKPLPTPAGRKALQSGTTEFILCFQELGNPTIPTPPPPPNLTLSPLMS